MKKKRVIELKEIAKTFPIRFRKIDLFKAQLTADTIGRRMIKGIRHDGFAMVSHLQGLKRVYVNEGKCDLELTKRIYTHIDELERRKFEGKYPGKHQELMQKLMKQMAKQNKGKVKTA
jgi:hypothetical protein